jgi:2-keto-4-pentenoate hydratase/2-oxohepta-3-ene-1,7-dioic acid hydratase in catechol pathway
MGALGRTDRREMEGIRSDDSSDLKTKKSRSGLAPCLPTKVVAIGLNYRDHAEEVKLEIPKEPVLFIKPSTSVIGPGEPILFPKMAGE